MYVNAEMTVIHKRIEFVVGHIGIRSRLFFVEGAKTYLVYHSCEFGRPGMLLEKIVSAVVGSTMHFTFHIAINGIKTGFVM
jgi:hypothetical protein